MADSQEAAAKSLATLSNSTTDPALLNERPLSPRKRVRTPEPVRFEKSMSPSAGFVTTPLSTGISEMAEAKRRRIIKETTPIQSSRNPAVEALNALSGGQATSKASNGPFSLIPTTPAMAPVSSAIETPTSSAQTSPRTIASTEGIIPSINAPRMASPSQIDQDELNIDASSNKAFSYPGPLLNAQLDERRGMSLPGSASRENARSSSTNKKHKCLYCTTEFTRHHNLKSHLLTHSHEKPYLCQTCNSRFRRLHDLKRHAKLHTGERPHICAICKRKFARGDALARHAKGQGGCAGRRSSMGEYVEDDSMEAMVYADDQSNEPEDLESEEAGASTVPSIRHHAPAQSPYRSDTSPTFSKIGSTYPPIAARANMGSGLYSSAPSHPPTSILNTAQYSGPYPPMGGGIFPTSQMTESPKPLEAGKPPHPPPPPPPPPGDPRNRSSSMGQGYARRGTRNTPPPSLPPPSTTNNQLPSLSGLAPPDSRYVLHSTPGAPGPSPTLPPPHSGTFPPHSASNSLSSHGTGHHTSGERGNMAFSAEDRLWAVIRTLEMKVDRLEDEIRMLRSQQPSPAQPGSVFPPPPPPNR